MTELTPTERAREVAEDIQFLDMPEINAAIFRELQEFHNDTDRTLFIGALVGILTGKEEETL